MSSRTRWNALLGAAALGGLALSVSSAAAQSVQTEKLHVQASIGEVCTVTSATLDFGPYEGATINGTGSIEINCFAPTTLDVALDGGQAGGTAGQRTLSNGTDTLSYLLYTNAAGGDAWESNEAVSATITGSASVPVFGTIPVQPDGHSSGLYTDEVTITLIF